MGLQPPSSLAVRHAIPVSHGQLDKTPRETLNLQPGDLVQVKVYDEILKTLNKRNRNKGLFFGSEWCPTEQCAPRAGLGVERIIHEPSGKMMTLPGECLILEVQYAAPDTARGGCFVPGVSILFGARFG